MEITASMVKELGTHGAGMMDCKSTSKRRRPRRQSLFSERKPAAAAKRSGRDQRRLDDAYIHMGGRIGVLIEVNCETDFVAKNAQFQAWCTIWQCAAASRPLYVSREQVPKMSYSESEIYRTQAINEGKPEKFADKIVEGGCSTRDMPLDQPFIRPGEERGRLIGENIGTIGENIR